MIRILLVLVCSLGVACGGVRGRSTTPDPNAAPVATEDLSGLRIVQGEEGLELYDAEDLFRQARAASRAGDCATAVARYDQLVQEFGGSPLASPALYNSALCLTRVDDNAGAARRYERLIRDYPESDDVAPARFQLAVIYHSSERWEELVALSEGILATEGISGDDRIEAMARRAQGLFGAGNHTAAARQAHDVLRYVRTRRPGEEVSNMGFIAAANFVLAETHRVQAEAVELPVGDAATQRGALEVRAQHMLNAQRSYFDTMRWTDPEWSAAAGYRIGSMYDKFWSDIMTAPVPPARMPLSDEEQTEYEAHYHREMARFVQPLLRHSVRYFELTLRMIERTGVDTEWQQQIEADLTRVRARLLEPIEDPPTAE